MVERRCVINAARAPQRAAMAAASQPACPPPITTTSKRVDIVPATRGTQTLQSRHQPSTNPRESPTNPRKPSHSSRKMCKITVGARLAIVLSTYRFKKVIPGDK
jgi:hypothetical protein